MRSLFNKNGLSFSYQIGHDTIIYKKEIDMISRIRMHNVASFSSPVEVNVDKRITLVYGLNGTGKSIISSYLSNPEAPEFKDCQLEWQRDEKILVYNEGFIDENFYVTDELSGIFTLSKENRAAEAVIKEARDGIGAVTEEHERLVKKSDEIRAEMEAAKQNAVDTVWEIKTQYSGGDRVLEYCLEGLKGKKETLFEHLSSLTAPDSEKLPSIDDLKKSSRLLTDDATVIEEIEDLELGLGGVESEPLLGQAIVGNESSSVAAVIDRFANADWVKKGLSYIPKDSSARASTCPFCQRPTITQELVENLKDYFDEHYESSISQLKTQRGKYSRALSELPTEEDYQDNPYFAEPKYNFEKELQVLKVLLTDNLSLIDKKIANPSISIELKPTIQSIENINQKIQSLNEKVTEHNAELKNKAQTRKRINDNFWKIMRKEYNPTLALYERQERRHSDSQRENTRLLAENQSKKKSLNELISSKQKETVNVEHAVEAINQSLLDLGISDFALKSHGDNKYILIRGYDGASVFKSLSEGEKMIISFLYFLQLCLGRSTPAEVITSRIVVIDDPISSLSHIFAFSVGRLIRRYFFFNESICSKLILLTHSLYFFYEMTDTNHKRRESTQELLRLAKNQFGSSIGPMKYEDIQNDYQAYWSIIKDRDQPAALTANCMRNIVEYFFNFIEHRNLAKIFDKPELQPIRFQAFHRFINRESHSLGQNIFDYKEFNYEIFHEALRLLFIVEGYEEHYKRMMAS